MDWSFVAGGAVTLIAAYFGHWSTRRIQKEQRQHEDLRRYHRDMVEAFVGFLSNLTELLGSFRKHVLLPDKPNPDADTPRVMEWNASLSESVHRMSLFAPSATVKKAKEAYDAWRLTLHEYSRDQDKARAEEGLKNCVEKMKGARKEMRRIIGSYANLEGPDTKA